MTHTCGWCRFFYKRLPQWAIDQNFVPETEECWVDTRPTHMSAGCGAWQAAQFFPQFSDEVADVSAHEKAELLRGKATSYHPGPR